MRGCGSLQVPQKWRLRIHAVLWLADENVRGVVVGKTPCRLAQISRSRSKAWHSRLPFICHLLPLHLMLHVSDPAHSHTADCKARLRPEQLRVHEPRSLVEARRPRQHRRLTFHDVKNNAESRSTLICIACCMLHAYEACLLVLAYAEAPRYSAINRTILHHFKGKRDETEALRGKIWACYGSLTSCTVDTVTGQLRSCYARALRLHLADHTVYPV